MDRGCQCPGSLRRQTPAPLLGVPWGVSYPLHARSPPPCPAHNLVPVTPSSAPDCPQSQVRKQGSQGMGGVTGSPSGELVKVWGGVRHGPLEGLSKRKFQG